MHCLFSVRFSKKTMRAAAFMALFVALAFSGMSNEGFAQEIQTDNSQEPANASKEAQKEELRRQLADLQKEIESLQQNMQEQTKKKEGFEREARILEDKVYRARLRIRQLDLAIRGTELQITETQETISDLNDDIEKRREHIAALLRQVYEQDNTDFMELILMYDQFSDFFDRIQGVYALQEGVRGALLGLQEKKKILEEKQNELVSAQEEQQHLRATQEFQKADLQDKQAIQKNLIKETRGLEEHYQKLTTERQKTAAEIRNQLFVLEGAGVAISFGDAYLHALFASKLTGVRPAFLLAVLKRESSWGQNVGQCYLVDAQTGLGKSIKTGDEKPRTMKADRDVQPFLQITQELGRDPYSTSVSCPLSYGYGGAMGPAQFIPSTWLGYRDKVTEVLGYMPDPWKIRDAFVASAVKLANAGADTQDPKTEWKAAMIYYAGGNWNKSAYWGYADWIMDKAEEYQNEIDVLVKQG